MGQVEKMEKIQIKKIKNHEIKLVEDMIVCEYPLTIFLNDEEFITLLCSPNGLKYLVVGFLISEGIIKNKNEIEKLIIDEEKGYAYVDIKDKSSFSEKLFGKRTLTTGCAKGTVFYHVLDSFGTKKIDSPIRVKADKILELSKKFNQASQLFKETGGVHSCALCDEENILFLHEDVGRHNALDKVIGEALLSDIRLDDKILISSGRISSEMILKSTKMNIPIIVSRSAPTDLSVRIAKQFNVTLIGFARGNRMNLYHGEERLNII